jgi:hypothetical protein
MDQVLINYSVIIRYWGDREGGGEKSVQWEKELFIDLQKTFSWPPFDACCQVFVNVSYVILRLFSFFKFYTIAGTICIVTTGSGGSFMSYVITRLLSLFRFLCWHQVGRHCDGQHWSASVVSCAIPWQVCTLFRILHWQHNDRHHKALNRVSGITLFGLLNRHLVDRHHEAWHQSVSIVFFFDLLKSYVVLGAFRIQNLQRMLAYIPW